MFAQGHTLSYCAHSEPNRYSVCLNLVFQVELTSLFQEGSCQVGSCQVGPCQVGSYQSLL
jgi:hypothetical protein